MINKIIKLADRMKDDTDLKLEALFGSDAVNDDGFSDRVMKRIRWQMRVRRFALPLAMLVGGAIAAKPAMDLLLVASRLVTAVPEDLRSLPLESLPQMSVVVGGLAAAGVMALFLRALEQ
jgi:hypothetical protein